MTVLSVQLLFWTYDFLPARNVLWLVEPLIFLPVPMTLWSILCNCVLMYCSSALFSLHIILCLITSLFGETVIELFPFRLLFSIDTIYTILRGVLHFCNRNIVLHFKKWWFFYPLILTKVLMLPLLVSSLLHYYLMWSHGNDECYFFLTSTMMIFHLSHLNFLLPLHVPRELLLAVQLLLLVKVSLVLNSSMKSSAVWWNWFCRF